MFSTGNARVTPSRRSFLDSRGVFSERLLGCIKGWRILALTQRVGASAQKVLRGLGGLFERRAQARDDRLGQGLSSGAANHDNVIAQTEDGAN